MYILSLCEGQCVCTQDLIWCQVPYCEMRTEHCLISSFDMWFSNFMVQIHENHSDTRVTEDFKLLGCDSSKASTGESKNQSDHRWSDFLWTVLTIRHACERETVRTVRNGLTARSETRTFRRSWLELVGCSVSHWLNDDFKTNTLTLCNVFSNTKQKAEHVCTLNDTSVSLKSKSQTRISTQKAFLPSRLKQKRKQESIFVTHEARQEPWIWPFVFLTHWSVLYEAFVSVSLRQQHLLSPRFCLRWTRTSWVILSSSCGGGGLPADSVLVYSVNTWISCSSVSRRMQNSTRFLTRCGNTDWILEQIQVNYWNNLSEIRWNWSQPLSLTVCCSSWSTFQH